MVDRPDQGGDRSAEEPHLNEVQLRRRRRAAMQAAASALGPVTHVIGGPALAGEPLAATGGENGSP
jgi:hypothetical protein